MKTSDDSNFRLTYKTVKDHRFTVIITISSCNHCLTSSWYVCLTEYTMFTNHITSILPPYGHYFDTHSVKLLRNNMYCQICYTNKLGLLAIMFVSLVVNKNLDVADVLTFPQLLTSAGNEQSLKTPRARISSQKLFTLNAWGSSKVRKPGDEGLQRSPPRFAAGDCEAVALLSRTDMKRLNTGGRRREHISTALTILKERLFLWDNYWSMHKSNLKSCRSDTLQPFYQQCFNIQLMCVVYIHTYNYIYTYRPKRFGFYRQTSTDQTSVSPVSI